ncbi:sensor histidine kinase [Halobellus sp. EA9]|uniref:sensor histidine kinase n=1 Tax=Halobellus sp. EA9 TaxID=3421647 RepID=UPI003EB8BB07
MLERRRERTSVPLAETLEAQIADVETTFGPASITVDGSLPQVRVLADGMLPSVFRNLLKNAIQHNDAASPEVVVSAVADGETVTVRVADNGPGVPEHLRSTIFAQGAKGLASGGTGIGLYLVRTLVEAYGGSVALEDSASGAVFAVELPAA